MHHVIDSDPPAPRRSWLPGTKNDVARSRRRRVRNRSAGVTGRNAAAVILAQLLLRAGSSAAALVVGSYFVDLARHGVPTTSILLGVLSGLSYLAELVLAPLTGTLSDRHGRRIFLILAPMLAALGVLFTPGASLFSVAPPLILVIVTVGTARLVDGAGAAMATPATLGFLADATDDDRTRRGRLTSLYELASSGGIALGAVIGPLLYAVAGLWSFALLALLYVFAGLLILVFVSPDRAIRSVPAGRRSLKSRLRVFTNRRLLAFLPAWVAVNAILGTWVTAQITFVLAGNRRIPGQLFPGAFAGHAAWLSAVLGIYVLVFSACIIIWSFFVGRLPALPTMLVTVAGSIIASAGLMLANHGMSPGIAVPIIVAGIFLEAGFTPAALTHLADISSDSLQDRGLIMGVYSVALGFGYLAGTVLGGVFAQWLAFDGLAWLTILLAAFALVSVLTMIRMQHHAARATHTA